jgi:ADP-ribosyl-[dinitrogen reductase] hydrolase
MTLFTTEALIRAHAQQRREGFQRCPLFGGDVGETALSIAVYSALATDDLNAALLVSINHDGDSDSTGAVCGNIVGALYGEDAIEPTWLAQLELREVVEAMAADVLAEFGPGRPPTTGGRLVTPGSEPTVARL